MVAGEPTSCSRLCRVELNSVISFEVTSKGTGKDKREIVVEMVHDHYCTCHVAQGCHDAPRLTNRSGI